MRFHSNALSKIDSRAVALSLLVATTLLTTTLAAHASDRGTLQEPAAAEEPRGAALEPGGAKRPRKLFGFALDAAVTPGLWAEVGQIYRQDESADAYTPFTLAYGWQAWEFGSEVLAYSTADFEVNDLGLWAKYVGWKLGQADVGAGLHIDVPLSGGDVEAAPFATASLPVGAWDLRSSFGYEITDDFLFNAAGLRALGDTIDFRAEFDTTFDTNFSWNVRLVPGLDFHFVRGRWDFLVRASAGALLHPEQAFLAALTFVLSES